MYWCDNFTMHSQVCFSSKALGVATSIKLPNLAVLSTDESFQDGNGRCWHHLKQSAWLLRWLGGWVVEWLVVDFGLLVGSTYYWRGYWISQHLAVCWYIFFARAPLSCVLWVFRKGHFQISRCMVQGGCCFGNCKWQEPKKGEVVQIASRQK